MLKNTGTILPLYTAAGRIFFFADRFRSAEPILSPHQAVRNVSDEGTNDTGENVSKGFILYMDEIFNAFIDNLF
jgi:hypothetical protein